MGIQPPLVIGGSVSGDKNVDMETVLLEVDAQRFVRQDI